MTAAGRPGRESPPLTVVDVLLTCVAGVAGFAFVALGAGVVVRGLGLAPPEPGSPAAVGVQALALAFGAVAALGADFSRRPGDTTVRLGLRWPGVAACACAFAGGLALQWPLAAMAAGVETVWPSPPEYRALLDRLLEPEGWQAWLAVVVALVVVAPLAEEFVFRGVLLRGLVASWGCVGATLGSSALFALVHGTAAAATYAFVAGVVLALLALRARSIWLGVALHAGVNAAPLLASASSLPGLTGATSNESTLSPGAYLSGAVVAAVLLAASLRVARRRPGR